MSNVDTSRPINGVHRRPAAPAESSEPPASGPGQAPAESSEPVTPKPAVTFTVHALLDDFPIDVQFSGSADQLAATVKRLRQLGAVPPTPAARQALAAERQRDAPCCPDEACDRYGKAMKESSKDKGGYYCPGKVGTRAGQPIYCKSRA